jgi:soluble lytic murein transglycosylase-like protein
MKVLIACILLVVIAPAAIIGQQSDAALRNAVEKDRAARTADGKLATLSAEEHLARGTIYYDNRVFPAAREHFQKIFDNYSSDPAMSGALFLTGRSYYWEREYEKAIPFLDRAAREFPTTKNGREGLSFKGACLVRLGRNAEAAKVYEQYTIMYPEGERVESAHTNLIDALREAGDYLAADSWVEKTRQRFADTPAEANALHARLRMQIYREQWANAAATAAMMQSLGTFRGSMTSLDEVKFLHGFALEKQRKGDAALAMYRSVGTASYFGGLVPERIDKLRQNGWVKGPAAFVGPVAPAPAAAEYPAPFASDVLFYSKKHKIDPRFVLAIMKQESGFRPGVKSPSAARGLLQLVYDTALKYNKKAGFARFTADDLYQPKVNIAIGTEYIADLKRQFGSLYEAIAASYNGGEDNAARWLNRSKPKEAPIFASEVGFSETKNYVFKVMNNYRAYRTLYDENLNRR